MTRWIVRGNPMADVWERAPWNNGQGGTYQPAADDDNWPLYFMCLNDLEEARESVQFFVADFGDEEPDSITRLNPADKLFSDHYVRLKVPEQHLEKRLDFAGDGARAILSEASLYLATDGDKVVVVWCEPQSYAHFNAAIEKHQQEQRARRPLRRAEEIDRARTDAASRIQGLHCLLYTSRCV